MKNDGRSKQSSIIENEVEAINTSSDGKAMISLKQHGSLPCVLKEVAKKLSERTATIKTLTLNQNTWLKNSTLSHWLIWKKERQL